MPPTPAHGVPRDRSRARTGHAADERLRRFGFRVLARPAAGPALWGRDDHTYTQAEAEAVVARELKRLETAGGPPCAN